MRQWVNKQPFRFVKRESIIVNEQPLRNVNV
jgi:hypothetical protein